MKKFIKNISIIILIIIVFFPATAFCDEISDMLIDQYDQYDFSALDDIFNNNGKENFSETVKSILDGSFNQDESFWTNITNILLPSFKKGLGNLPLMLILMLIFSLLNSILNDGNKFLAHINSTTNAIVSIMLIYSFVIIFKQAVEAYGTLNEILDAIIPILTVALISSGGTGTAEAINPESAMLSNTVGNIITNIVFPLIMVIAVLLVLDSVFIKDKFSKIISMGRNTATWIIGTVFTLFAAIISIKGLVASSYDGISLRTFRYAISNSVPLIGSLAGDGVNMALACCSVVKSAIGVAALVLIIITMASPIMTLIAYMLSLKLIAACASPLGNVDAVNLVSSMADLAKVLISALIGMIIVLFIIIGFAVGAANVI